MITGDQGRTAVAVGKQVGIVTLKTNLDLKELGYSSSEALQKANAIVVSGDMINRAFEDGDEVHDFYSGKTFKVEKGMVKIGLGTEVVLLEKR